MVSYLREVSYMSDKKTAKILFILCTVTLVLPWFTFSGTMMGYCWGAEFYVFFLVPMILVWYCLFGKGTRGMQNILGILGCSGNIGALIWSLGSWQERHNICGGFHFLDGLRTATACFWCTVAVHILLFAEVSISAANREQKRGGA